MNISYDHNLYIFCINRAAVFLLRCENIYLASAIPNQNNERTSLPHPIIHYLSVIMPYDHSLSINYSTISTCYIEVLARHGSASRGTIRYRNSRSKVSLSLSIRYRRNSTRPTHQPNGNRDRRNCWAHLVSESPSNHRLQVRIPLMIFDEGLRSLEGLPLVFSSPSISCRFPRQMEHRNRELTPWSPQLLTWPSLSSSLDYTSVAFMQVRSNSWESQSTLRSRFSPLLIFDIPSTGSENS